MGGCSFDEIQVSVQEYINPEMEIFESFSWSDASIGFITDTVTAMDMPKLKPAKAVQSYTLTVSWFNQDHNKYNKKGSCTVAIHVSHCMSLLL